MKVQIPDQLKTDMPPTHWGKILTATPVVMAVVATMLAGLASSEMTRAQYDRALAAQQQSKAGDQWSFFQAKRLRGAIQRNSMDLLQNTVGFGRLRTEALNECAAQSSVKEELIATLQSATGQQALTFLREGKVPSAGPERVVDVNVKAALQAVEALKTDAEVAALLAKADPKTLEAELAAARDQAQDFDATTKPINQVIDRIDELFSRSAEAAGGKAPGASVLGGAANAVTRDFTAARLRYAALRYEIEARLNQAIANLYELQVRKSNISAERHHARSQRFFFGMLGAQMGVIISTFALAARNRNFLWALAAGAGLVAIAFAIYVYLCV